MKILLELIKINFVKTLNRKENNNILNKMNGITKFMVSNLILLVFIYLGHKYILSIIAKNLIPEYRSVYFNIIIIFSSILSLWVYTPILYDDLFNSKDKNILLTLPIKKEIITFSKIINILLYFLKFYTFIFISAYISELILVGYSTSVLMKYIIMTLILSVFNISISMLIVNIIFYISNTIIYKLKHIFKFLPTIITLVMIPLSLSLNKYINEKSIDNISNVVKQKSSSYLYIINLITSNVNNSIFKGIVILFILSLLLIPLIYLCNYNISKEIRVYNPKVKYISKEYKKNSIVLEIIKKDIQLIFKDKTLLVQIISPFFIYAFFILKGISESRVSNNSSSQPIIVSVGILILFNTLLSFLSVYTINSFNLEKHGIKILKTLPIEFKDILKAKFILGVSIYLPVTIINTIIFYKDVISIDLIYSILAIILSLEILVYSTLNSLLIAIFNFNFDFETNIAVLRSKGFIIGFILNLFIFILGSIIFTFVFIIFDLTLTLLIFSIIIMLLIIIIYLILENIGSKRYNNLNL